MVTLLPRDDDQMIADKMDVKAVGEHTITASDMFDKRIRIRISGYAFWPITDRLAKTPDWKYGTYVRLMH